MKRSILSLWDSLTDLIYPSNIYCISCGNIIDDSRPYALCDTCVITMNWANERTCNQCGKILRAEYFYDLCTDCSIIEHSFEKGFTCVEYGRAEREIIHNFKYKDKAYLGRKLAEIMYDRIRLEDINPDIIIPVPMHKRKENKRGYNQAAVLATMLARFMKKPSSDKILIRTIDTEPMSNLGAEERRENIRKAFTVRQSFDKILKDKTVLLIDDVFTTGSTADACTDVLLAAGAAKVYVFVFASGANI